MLFVVYFTTSDGHNVITGTFLMEHDAKLFLTAQNASGYKIAQVNGVWDKWQGIREALQPS